MSGGSRKRGSGRPGGWGVRLPGPDPAAADATACALARSCGGCSLIGSPYSLQLEYKRAVLSAAMGEVSALSDAPVEACLPSPEPDAYRNRAKLAVRRVGDGVRVGLFRRGTNRIVAFPGCRVHRPAIEERLAPLISWIEDHRLAAPEGLVKYIDLREAAGGALHLTLVARDDGEPEGGWPLDELSTRGVPLAGVCLNVNPDSSSYVFGESTSALRGDAFFSVSLPGFARGLRVPATGFLQVNPSLLEPIHRLMDEHLGHDEDLHDLYCGVGVHGLRLVGESGRLFGYESHTDAVGAARVNASARLAKTRFSFFAGPCEETFRARSAPRVVLNPGRSGCRPELLDRLLDARPRRVAYLSCNPRSLARDLSRLVLGGLHLDRLIPVDMMPQTEQVEALALLSGG